MAAIANVDIEIIAMFSPLQVVASASHAIEVCRITAEKYLPLVSNFGR